MLVGNVTATAVWKVFADRTRQLETIAFAQRLVTITDWWLTAGGALMIMIGGYGMVWTADLSLTSARWLWAGQALFFLSGAVWLLAIVPIQIAQSRLARGFGSARGISMAYWRLCRLWIVFGVLATVPMAGALFLMIAKTP